MLKRFFVSVLLLAVAVPVLAQRPVRQRLQKGPAVQGRQLGRGLDLTPAQIDQLKAINQGDKAQRQAIQQETQQKRQALNALMAQSNPDPAQVGQAMLALKQAQLRGQQLREQSLESFKRILTADQLKKFEEQQSGRKNLKVPRRRGLKG